MSRKQLYGTDQSYLDNKLNPAEQAQNAARDAARAAVAPEAARANILGAPDGEDDKDAGPQQPDDSDDKNNGIFRFLRDSIQDAE